MHTLAGAFKNLVIVTLIGSLAVWNNALLADSTGKKIRVLLFKEGLPVWVEREIPVSRTTPVPSSTDDTIAITLQQRLLSQLFGPTETELDHGFSGFFPAGSQLDKVTVENGQATIYLTLPTSYLENLDTVSLDFFADLLSQFVDEIQRLKSISINARSFYGLEYHPLREFLPPPPSSIQKRQGKNADIPIPRWESSTAAERQAQPTGALSNASIFLSPGHGWYQNDGWLTQRGETNNIVEDHSNAETVFQYLVQYLWNAGAQVYTTRERDMNPNMVIVDNKDDGYSETGRWVTFNGGSPYKGSVRYAATVTGKATATATFTPNIPEDGYYAVYVWYLTSLSESESISTDTQITINHTGDSTVWIQNQNRDGLTWKYVGTYYFQAGSHPETGSVVISNSSRSSKNVVVADAVRFGGGIGTSGHPRWEESGLSYMGFMGNHNARRYNRVTALPAYAAWEYESWEEGKSIYVSWHTNAGGGAGTGTETYAYSSLGIGGRFNGVPGSLELRDAIHEELLNDIRTGWDANWVDRGKRTNWYGELSPRYNNKMPSTIVEIGFHDNVADANAISDPNFRRLTARAVYQGIVKFYSKQITGFSNSKLLPEPPTHFRVVNNGFGEVTLAWEAPLFNVGDGLLGDAATGYQVYRSRNGKGFDNGIEVAHRSITLNDLTPGEVYYFRVTATNIGGESFPTETLAVRVRGDSGNAPILIVNGFDRIDRQANIMEKNVARGYLARMNSYDYIIAYAKAIQQYGKVDFEASSNEALIAGQISLDDYEVVIWMLGEESTVNHTFDATEQQLVSHFLGQGGKLFVSGSEIGWELGRPSSAGLNFYNNQLVSKFVADEGGSYTAAGVAGTIFENISSLKFDNGKSIYDVKYPDRIAANLGAVVNLNYTSPGTGGAAIQYRGGNPERRLVMMAIPFETITEENVRNTVMANVLNFFGVTKAVVPAQMLICDANGNQANRQVAVDMRVDVVKKAPSLLTQVNELPELKNNHWQLTQDPETDQLRLTLEGVNYAVFPVRVWQQAKPAQFTAKRDGSVIFVTTLGREIVAQPIVQNIPALCKALAASTNEVVWQDNGILSVKLKENRAVARADIAAHMVSNDEPLGLSPAKNGHSQRLVFVDETGQKRQQLIHPFCAYPEALSDYQADQDGTEALELANDGTVSVTIKGKRYHGVFDYIVYPSQAGEKPKNAQLVFTPIYDKDKTVGFTVTYPTGETQLLRLKSNANP
jgi:N-acetylmuramoyl-L-alanine amidase